MRLCLALGKTLGELCESMTVEEFEQWVEFDRMRSLPDVRDEYYHAMQAQATTNMAGKAIERNVPIGKFLIFREQAKPKEQDAMEFFKSLT